MKLRRLLVVMMLCSAGGCSDQPLGIDDEDDYIVFGDFYGFCQGRSCIDLFKIQDGNVYEDRLDRYPSSMHLPHEVDFKKIGSEHYDELAELLSEIPEDLYDEDDRVIGQPDAGDWGGFYLETRFDGVKRYWIIDKMEENLPDYLHPFITKMQEAIDLVDTPEI